MELTTEQQQALQNLTKVFSLKASQEDFNSFFQDEIEDLKELNERQEEINMEVKDLMRYNDTTIDNINIVELVEEYSQNQREIRRISNRLTMAQNLLVRLGVNLS
jgi:predicted transcriptional regulator